MRFFSLLPLLLTAVNAKSLNCEGTINVRKNWIDLNPTQQEDFVKAYKKLMHESMIGSSGELFVDYFTRMHASYGGGIHGTALFFPWHRYFLSMVEQKLQVAGKKKSLSLPLWDWSLESQSLGTSLIWRTFGGNGVVKTGSFANLQVQYPQPHNIWRNFNDGTKNRRNIIGAAASFSMVEKFLDLRSYEDLQDRIEYIHGTVHVILGGDMGDVKTSPNDPLFYLHHCFVDKIWWRWQLRGHARNFNGINYFNSKGIASLSNKRQATSQDLLYPFTDWKVEDVFDTKALCYTYSLSGEEQYDDQISANPVSTHGSPKGGNLNALASIFRVSPGSLAKAPVGEKLPTPADQYVRILALDQLGRAEQDCVELFKVKPFTHVTPEWIALNNLNPRIAAIVEENNEKFVKELDNVKGFISPSSLYNQVDLMIGLVAAGARCFKATINQGVVVIRIPDSELKETPAMRVYNMQNRLLKTIKTENLMSGFKEVANEIEQVIQVTRL